VASGSDVAIVALPVRSYVGPDARRHGFTYLLTRTRPRRAAATALAGIAIGIAVDAPLRVHRVGIAIDTIDIVAES